MPPQHRGLLRELVADDEPRFIAAVKRSRRLHRPWVNAADTAEKFAQVLARAHEGNASTRVLVSAATGDLIGVFNLSNIVRGPLQSAFLGYYVFAGFERQGLMRDGLALMLRHAFRTLQLHRLEANIQPANVASIALVRSCGFRKEGFSPRYLKIGGRWRDHERWARLADNP